MRLSKVWRLRPAGEREKDAVCLPAGWEIERPIPIMRGEYYLARKGEHVITDRTLAGLARQVLTWEIHETVRRRAE